MWKTIKEERSTFLALGPGPHIFWGDVLLGSCWNGLDQCSQHLQKRPQPPHAPSPKRAGNSQSDIPAWTQASLPLSELGRAGARQSFIESRADPLRMFLLWSQGWEAHVSCRCWGVVDQSGCVFLGRSLALHVADMGNWGQALATSL